MKSRISIFDIIGTAVRFVVVIVLILFFVSRAKSFYGTGYRIFADFPIDAEGEGHTVEVTVTDGMSGRSLGRLLKEKGLIEDELAFFVQERLSEEHGHVVGGTYELSTEMNAEEIIAALTADYDASAGSAEDDNGAGSGAAETEGG